MPVIGATYRRLANEPEFKCLATDDNKLFEYAYVNEVRLIFFLAKSGGLIITRGQ